MNHTPGPWKWDIKKYGQLTGSNGGLIIDDRGVSTTSSNARLIAAAPSLLAELKRLVAAISAVGFAYDDNDKEVIANASYARAQALIDELERAP